MTTRQITPPAALAVLLSDAKDTLRIDQADTAFDAQLTLWIKAVTEEAEGAANQVFITQHLRMTLDAFPTATLLRVPDAIVLRAPLISVESVKYIDTVGQQQTLDPASYVVITDVVPGRVVPAYGLAWPATLNRAAVVTVDFTAGYGPDATTVPQRAQLYILARLAEQWDPLVKEFKATVKSNFVDRLLDSLRVYG